MMFADERKPADKKISLFEETFRQKANGGGVVFVVDLYDFQRSLSTVWRRLAGGGDF